MARIDGATELLPRPTAGRTFTVQRRVRLADTDASGYLRLDALARYAQDIASDDAREALPGAHLAWVVRRTLLEVQAFPQAEDVLELTTWCSGYGSRWAERRTSITGADGGNCDLVVLWVAIDTTRGTPARLDDRFTDAYAEAASGRQVAARLQHPDPPIDAAGKGPGSDGATWTFRATDVDRLGHVNNAAYWCVAEDLLLCHDRPRSLRAEVEYRAPIDAGVELVASIVEEPSVWRAWLLSDDTTVASISIAPESSPSAVSHA